MVLGHNFQLIEHPQGSLSVAITRALDAGWIGVQLFFVLSGFLITRILIASSGQSNYYSKFFSRRLLRIFPVYYASLLILFYCLPFVSTRVQDFVMVDREHQLWYWLYLSNFSTSLRTGGNALPHFWSLAVEGQFYLIWPFFINHLSPTSVLRACLALAAASFLFRAGMLALDLPADWVYSWTPSHLDALALGGAGAAFLAIYGTRPKELIISSKFSLLIIILFAVGALVTKGYPRTTVIGQTVGYSVLSIVFSLVILSCALHTGEKLPRWLRILESASLRRVGLYSYAAYVIHKPLHDLVGVNLIKKSFDLASLGLGMDLIYLFGATGLTLICASISYELLERPLLRLSPKLRLDAR